MYVYAISALFDRLEIHITITQLAILFDGIFAQV